MKTFQNRESELNMCFDDSDESRLLNIYGETGIGKSSLLAELIRRLRNKSPASLIIHIDFEDLHKSDSNIDADKEAFEKVKNFLLAKMLEDLTGRLIDLQQDQQDSVNKLVVKLIQTSISLPVYLLMDTTEKLQENMAFWRWMEEYVVGPLIVEGKATLIFAGRVPVPWRRFEVRRVVKRLPLKPLKKDVHAIQLVREVLQETNSGLDDPEYEEAADLVLEFSFGHPLLSEELAKYVAENWPQHSSPEFRLQICRDLIEPFISRGFFKTVAQGWQEILRWASVLDWFDATILPRYLKRIAPDLVENKTEFDFIEGITQLRIKDRVVWPVDKGEQLHGVIGNVVQKCFKTLHPNKYRLACEAAAETFFDLAKEFPEGNPEAAYYNNEAGKYLRYTEMEGIK